MDKASATPNEIGGSKPPMGAQAPLQPLPAGDGDELASSPASSAAQTWLVQVFSFHADYIARDGGVRLPSGWEPLRIEATGGNKYRVYARKQEVAT